MQFEMFENAKSLKPFWGSYNYGTSTIMQYAFDVCDNYIQCSL